MLRLVLLLALGALAISFLSGSVSTEEALGGCGKVQIGIAAEAQNISRINVAFAGTIVAFLPMLLLVVAFQRYLVRGLFGGSVKG